MLIERRPVQMLRDVVSVDRLAAGIGDNHQATGVMGDHEVIDDAAGLVQQQGISLAALRQTLEVPGRQRFQHLRRTIAGQAELAHVRYVEQAGGGAGVQVLGQYTGRILDRHGIAGEWH